MEAHLNIERHKKYWDTEKQDRSATMEEH